MSGRKEKNIPVTAQNPRGNRDGRSLRSRAGASLAEMLLATALMGIVLVAVSSGIGALRTAYDGIVRKSEALTLLSTLNTAISADLSGADISSITLGEEGSSQENTREVDGFYSGKQGFSMTYVNGTEDAQGRILIRVLSPAGQVQGTESVMDLLPDKAYTDGLKAELTDFTFTTTDLGTAVESTAYGALTDTMSDAAPARGYFNYTLHIFTETSSGERTMLEEKTFSVSPVMQ